MRRIEGDRGGDDWVSGFAEELGLHIPLAPVVVRTYSPTMPSAEDTWLQIRNPHGINYCWVTTEINGATRFSTTHLPVAVVDRRGRASEVGIAVPRNSQGAEPFFFHLSAASDSGELRPVSEGIVVQHLGSYMGSMIYRLGHRFIPPNIPQEWYFVFHIQEWAPEDRIMALAPPRLLVSGASHGGFLRRFLSDRISQPLPFSYLQEME